MKAPKRIYPYIKREKYFNCEYEKSKGFLIQSSVMLFNSLIKRLFCKGNDADWICREIPAERSEKPVITWIGHATFLIQIGSVNIITDPIFGDVSFLFKRILPPGIPIEGLPSLDCILLSHNHYDHLDLKSIQFLRRSHYFKIFVPHGDKHWLERQHGLANRIDEYMWWGACDVKNQNKPQKEVRCTFLPAFHWSQRGIRDKNKSLWGSWMIEAGNYRIYFAGDTAYSHHFKSIQQEFESIDIALLPIGPCEPRRWMKNSHMSAEDAGQAFIDLKAKHLIPMHWGTFNFGTDRSDLPIKRLHSWWQEHDAQVNDKVLHFPKIGQRILF